MRFHPKIKTLIQYAAEELAEPKMISIKNHIDTCARCREKLIMVQNIGTVRQPVKSISPEFKAQVLNKLEEPKWDTQPIIAEIKSIVGEVIVFRGHEGEGRVGFPGMGLKKGEMIKLNQDSLALIELNDGSYLWLNRKTELQFTFADQALSLRSGELFAMFKPQPKVFEILTPTAVLGVIGTEFDAEVHNGSKTDLRVIKGKVSVTNESGKVIVKKKQQVEAEKYTLSQPKKIKNKEQVMQWTKPLNPKKQRGRAVVKYLVLFLLVFIAVTGVVFYLKSKEKPANLTTIPVTKIAKLDKTEPLVLNSSNLQQGAVWRIIAKSQMKKGEQWVDYWKMTNRAELIENTEKEGSRVVLTIEDCSAPEWSEEATVVLQMIGRKFVYQVSPEGQLAHIDVYDGKPLAYTEIAFYLDAFSSVMSGMYQKKQLTPGEQWADSYEGNIPGYPQSYIKVNSTYTFSGYENRDGVEVGIIKSNSKGSFGGGFALQKRVEQNGTHYVLVDNLNFDTNSEVILDAKTGRVISVTSSSVSSDNKLTILSYLKGNSQPVSRPLSPQPPNLSRTYVTIEYPK